jgi:DNA polymerase elongation subunit (family B)
VSTNFKPAIFALAIDNVETPVIRMFGVTADGNSVAAFVHNFTSYFYAHIEAKGINPSQRDLEVFKQTLETAVHAPGCVVQIELVEKYPIMFYQEEK